MTRKFHKEQFDFFEPDKLRLDEEWVRQPKLYFDHAAMLADANADHERAKKAKELVVAELARDVRRDPAAFGLAKVTEDGVSQTIALHARYSRACDDLTDARHDVDVLRAVVDALEQRKKALESLVYLHGQSYFAQPQTPRGMRDEVSAAEANKAFGGGKRKARG